MTLSYRFITKENVKAYFSLAGIEILEIEPLVDQYYGGLHDPETFCKRPQECCWWFIQTKVGWIKLGWRKRVVEIDWSYTSIREKVTNDENVTSETNYVHAWDEAKLLEYLRVLKVFIDKQPQPNINL